MVDARMTRTPLVAVSLQPARDLGASLFGVDLADARVEHELGKFPAPFVAGRRPLAVVRDALGQCFPSQFCASGFVATWLEAIEALLENHRGGKLTATFTGRRLRIGASLFLALREELTCFSAAAVYSATLVETLHLMLRGLGLATLLAGWRRALLDALEEAMDRTAKARLAVAAVIGACIEDGQRRHNARVTALAGRHTFPIGSLVENGRELSAVGCAATASLEQQHGCHENLERGCLHRMPAYLCPPTGLDRSATI
jgi:hypothetical protein